MYSDLPNTSHKRHIFRLTAVLYVVGTLVVYVRIVLQLVQLLDDVSRVLVVYFHGIALFRGIGLRLGPIHFRETFEHGRKRPVIGFASQTRAIILKRPETNEPWLVSIRREHFFSFFFFFFPYIHFFFFLFFIEYLRGLENTDEIGVLLGVVYVVAEFLDALVESQKRLMVYLPWNEERACEALHVATLHRRF